MYFDTEPYNNWNVEKAYEVYKNNTNTSSDVFKDMKKDLEDIKNSVNTFKKAREKAEEILLKWDKFTNSIKGEAHAPRSDQAPTTSAAVVTNNVLGTQNFHNRITTFNQNKRNIIEELFDDEPSPKRRDIRDEIDEFFNPEEQNLKEATSSEPFTLEASVEDYGAVSDKPYMIGSHNITVLFNKFKKLSAEEASSRWLLVETDSDKILALSNVILLKEDQHPPDLVKVFGIDALNSIKNDLKMKFDLDNVNDMNEKLKADIQQKVKLIKDKIFTIKQGAKAVGNLTSNDENYNAQDAIIIGVRNLLESIPKQKFQGLVQEDNLSSNYVGSVLKPIFTIPDQNKYLNWSSTQELPNSSKQPDIVGKELKGVNWYGPLVITEVKGEDRKDYLYDCLVDLIRIGTMAVDSININSYNGIIGVHTVGLQMTFYLISLMGPKVYVMMEVCSITLPKDFTCIRSYIANVEDLMVVPHSYMMCNVVEDREEMESFKAGKLDIPSMKQLFKTPGKDIKPVCPYVINH